MGMENACGINYDTYRIKMDDSDAMSIKTRAQLRAARALLERGQLDEFHLSIVTDDSSPVDQCIDCSIFLSSSLVRAERWHHNQKSRSSPQGDRQ